MTDDDKIREVYQRLNSLVSQLKDDIEWRVRAQDPTSNIDEDIAARRATKAVLAAAELNALLWEELS